MKLKDLTREDLYEMYVVKKMLDSDIADICGCTKQAVRNKRQKLKVYASEQIIYKAQQVGVNITADELRELRIRNNEKVI